MVVHQTIIPIGNYHRSTTKQIKWGRHVSMYFWTSSKPNPSPNLWSVSQSCWISPARTQQLPFLSTTWLKENLWRILTEHMRGRLCHQKFSWKGIKKRRKPCFKNRRKQENFWICGTKLPIAWGPKKGEELSLHGGR